MDKFITDSACRVRAAVAKQGYGLNVLINDNTTTVRNAVDGYLTANHTSIEEWIATNKNNKNRWSNATNSKFIKH